MHIELFYGGQAFRRIRSEDLTDSLVRLIMDIEDWAGCPGEFVDRLLSGEFEEAWILVEPERRPIQKPAESPF